ncbi:MAG TPA: methyltransferase domain-containing protein [Pyrinomonadaceae bacterium]|jgi:SAM-dependent methyltransferase
MDISKLNRLKTGRTGRLVVSASTRVRWDDGKLLISSSGSKDALSTTDARLLQVLHAFAAPRLPREVEDELRQFGQGFLFTSIVALWQIDALVADDEEESDAMQDADEHAPGDAFTADDALAERSNTTAQSYAQSIARLVRTIACDLAGFGADAHRFDPAHGRRLSLVARLGDVERTLSGVASELEERRAPHLASQLSKLQLSGASRGLRLNLGSGDARLEGWVNIDLAPAELSMHLGWGLPFADASVEYLYISHVLEHMYKEEARDLLAESRRVLAPAGVVRVVVPDLEKCLRAYAAGDADFFETRRKFWPRSSRLSTTPLEFILKNAGAGIKPGRFWGHKHGYDFQTLAHDLRRAGFTRVERSEYMKSPHAPLLIDDAAKTTDLKFRDSHFSLFVEASK